MRLFAVLALACLFGCCSVQRTIAPIPTIRSTIDATVGLVEPDTGKTFRIFCSGVFIAPGLVLTAAHCADEPYDLTPDEKQIGELLGINPNPIGHHLFFATHEEMKKEDVTEAWVAEIVAFDQDKDLALLKVVPTGNSVVPIAAGNPITGENVWSVGNTLGFAYSLHPGVISAVRLMKTLHDVPEVMLQVSSTAWKGSSGGGLFNQDGELLGICSFLAAPGGQTIGMVFFVSVEEIHKFLDAQKP